jgi:hypothetical protein
MNSNSNRNRKSYPKTLAQQRLFYLLLIERLYPLGVSVEGDLDFLELPYFVKKVLNPPPPRDPNNDDMPRCG